MSVEIQLLLWLFAWTLGIGLPVCLLCWWYER